MTPLFALVDTGDNPSVRTDPTGLIATQLTTGCLLTGNGNIECNVQVNSAQWNNEVANGATVITSLAGASLLELVPILCGNAARVCLISLRGPRMGSAPAGRASDYWVCNFVGTIRTAFGTFVSFVADGDKFL